MALYLVYTESCRLFVLMRLYSLATVRPLPILGAECIPQEQVASEESRILTV